MEIEGAMDILLVDSNCFEAELTARELRKHVANPIHILSDGQRLVKWLLGPRENGAAALPVPQFILMDVHTQLSDPLELVTFLRQQPSTSRVPVILLTSSEQESEALATRLPSACTCVTKPVNLEKLAEAFRAVQARWLLLDEKPVVNSARVPVIRSG